MPRFYTPLIEPDVQISRIRLSEEASGCRPRKTGGSRLEPNQAKLRVQAETPFHRVLLMTLYATGARRAEVALLKISDSRDHLHRHVGNPMRPRIDRRHRGPGEGTLFTDEARKRRDDFVYRGHCDSATEVIRRVVPRIGPATFGLFEPAEPA